MSWLHKVPTKEEAYIHKKTELHLARIFPSLVSLYGVLSTMILGMNEFSKNQKYNTEAQSGHCLRKQSNTYDI